MALEENNSEIIKETISNIKLLFTKVKQIEIRCFLSNENDTLDSYLEFHADNLMIPESQSFSMGSDILGLAI